MRADEKDRRDESLMREQEMMKKNKRRFRAFERARQVWNKRMKRKDGVQCICIILIKGLIKKFFFFLDECYSAHL